MTIKHFNINQVGRDFVVGDIHGCFTKLQEQLYVIGFDESKDRLFSVGDLVDRGPESRDFTKWLDKPWFHAVRGNHDQMIIDAVRDDDSYIHRANGGQWFYELPEVEQQCMAIMMEELPLAIEIDTPNGLVGLVHAESHTNWYELRSMLSGTHERLNEPMFMDSLKGMLMWARTKISYNDEEEIKGLHKLYVGHTPVKDNVQLGNVRYIDTGACFKGGHFTIERIN